MEKGKYGNVLNIPVPSGYGSSEYRQIFDDHVFPFIQNFSPDLLIISAGFDAHKDDPLAGINLSDEDYAYMTKCCLEINSNLLLGLEGGYNLDTIASASSLCMRALRGDILQPLFTQELSECQ